MRFAAAVTDDGLRIPPPRGRQHGNAECSKGRNEVVSFHSEMGKALRSQAIPPALTWDAG